MQDSLGEIPAKTNFKYYDVIGALFVAVLIISNIASAKVASVAGFNFDGGTILFPISYIFGDVLTEVYGYKKSRRIIWTGFLCLAVMALTLAAVQYLPSAIDWPNQSAYEAVLGFVPRLVLASMLAYWAGEFSNSYILAKMKVWTKGRQLWSRTIGSTIVGEGVDSIVFSFAAFYGTMPLLALLNLIGTIYVFKVLYEILATPLTYKVINFLKRTEQEDYYDKNTNFNPFTVSER
ncbi:MAG: queuosine precursor transporter [Candidatus Doudnabacteria bacterium]|nr:queuosine precursor transporter [Candidatus Doudnabacteria bacterium]